MASTILNFWYHVVLESSRKLEKWVLFHVIIPLLNYYEKWLIQPNSQAQKMEKNKKKKKQNRGEKIKERKEEKVQEKKKKGSSKMLENRLSLWGDSSIRKKRTENDVKYTCRLELNQVVYAALRLVKKPAHLAFSYFLSLFHVAFLKNMSSFLSWR